MFRKITREWLHKQSTMFSGMNNTSLKNNHKELKKPQLVIQHVQGWNLSTKNRHVSIKSFSGARVEDMEDYLKPLIRKEPDELILHMGTNNIRDDDPREVAEGIVNVAFQIEQNSPNTNISISSILQ